MDAYRIGVTIALANGVSPVLAIIGKDMLGLHATAGKVEQNFAGWSKALIGVGSILAGTTILGAMVKLTKQASEFNEQLIKMKRLGGEAGEAAMSGQLTKRAFDIAQRVPMKVQDIMKIPGVTYSIMGMHEADETWEPLARYAYVLQADKKYKGDVTTDLQKVIRAGELSGRITDPVTKNIDPHKLSTFLDQAAKIAAATHGAVGPDAMLAMAQQAGPALRGLTDSGFLTMAIQAQMMGGHRAGTSYLSLWQQLAGGTMMKRTAHGLEEMGFLKPEEWSTEGGHVSISKEASKRLGGLIGKDPLAFAKAINEELARRGITDPIEQMQAVMRMTGRQTTQRFTMEEVVAFNQMIAERERLMKGLGNGDAFKLLMDESVQANLYALSNAWDNLIVALAGPNSQNLITALQALTGGVNRMTDVVRGLDPATLDTIYKGLAAVAVGLTALGVVSLATLIGLPAFMTALAVALGTFAALNWDSIKTATSVLERVPIIFAPIVMVVRTIDLVVRAVGMLVSLDWKKVGDAMMGIYSAIAGFIDRIIGLAGKIGGMFSNPNKGGESGDSVGSGLNQPMNFNPGAREAPKQQFALSLNIDGRTLAQSVSDEMTSLYAFATGGSASDGLGYRQGGGFHHT